jgi:hypothetical protein
MDGAGAPERGGKDRPKKDGGGAKILAVDGFS